jgi:serine/threonine protein phosphatase 1
MTKTYAIGDIHGRFDLLDRAMATIIRRQGHDPATVVTLGDYVDRGPDSKKVIDALKDGSPLESLDLICLKGNHEDIMWQTCRILPYASWWISNGGYQTLLSYGHPDVTRDGPAMTDDVSVGFVDDDHLAWINNLPLMHVDQHRVYVHAGVAIACPLDEQVDLIDMHGNLRVLWKRYIDGDEGQHYSGLHTVHGHKQHDKPLLKLGRTGLDTGAYLSGRLTIGVFDDDVPGGPIELIEVTV